jgi:hypothetical protein
MNRETMVRMTLRTIERRMDVAKGIRQVIFFPCIKMSPGNLPKGIFIRDARYDIPAKTRKMTPIIRNILVRLGTIFIPVDILNMLTIFRITSSAHLLEGQSQGAHMRALWLHDHAKYVPGSLVATGMAQLHP